MLSDLLLTVKSELSPQITSLRRRVGAQPRPSIEFCRNRERHMSPVTDIFGCHSLVAHFTFGGCTLERNTNYNCKLIISRGQQLTVILYSSGTTATNLNFPSFQKPSSGVIINVNSLRTSASAKNTLHVLGRFCSISCTSLTRRRSRIETRFCPSPLADIETLDASFLSFLVRVIISRGWVNFRQVSVEQLYRVDLGRSLPSIINNEAIQNWANDLVLTANSQGEVDYLDNSLIGSKPILSSSLDDFWCWSVMEVRVKGRLVLFLINIY